MICFASKSDLSAQFHTPSQCQCCKLFQPKVDRQVGGGGGGNYKVVKSLSHSLQEYTGEQDYPVLLGNSYVHWENKQIALCECTINTKHNHIMQGVNLRVNFLK